MDHNVDQAAHEVARGLGWFSIALGAAELAAPDALARMIGARPHSALIRAYGAREMAAGIGLLSGRGTAEWLWARVAGDTLDLASLWLAAEERGADRTRLGLAAAAVAGVTLLDLAAASYLTAADGTAAAEEAVEPINDEPIPVSGEPALDLPIT